MSEPRPCILLLGRRAVGRCVTWQEADAICDRCPDLLWDFLPAKRQQQLLLTLPLLTVGNWATVLSAADLAAGGPPGARG